MKRKIRLIILICFIAGVAVTGFNMAQNNQSTGVSLSDIAVMAMARGESDPDCMEWGYKTWNYWLSGSDGVDCACQDREKVWSTCNGN